MGFSVLEVVGRVCSGLSSSLGIKLPQVNPFDLEVKMPNTTPSVGFAIFKDPTPDIARDIRLNVSGTSMLCIRAKVEDRFGHDVTVILSLNHPGGPHLSVSSVVDADHVSAHQSCVSALTDYFPNSTVEAPIIRRGGTPDYYQIINLDKIFKPTDAPRIRNKQFCDFLADPTSNLIGSCHIEEIVLVHVPLSVIRKIDSQGLGTLTDESTGLRYETGLVPSLATLP
jgi:hypothetical protein